MDKKLMNYYIPMHERELNLLCVPKNINAIFLNKFPWLKNYQISDSKKISEFCIFYSKKEGNHKDIENLSMKDVFKCLEEFQSKRSEKVIFLDIDGVLNGYSMYINRWKKHRKYLIFPKYMRRLKYIVKKTGARIVLISSMSNGILDEKLTKSENQFDILFNFSKYHIEISATIYNPTLCSEKAYERDELIKIFIENEKDKNLKYIILDDESCFYKNTYLAKHLVHTAERNFICGFPEENTGLKIKNVKQAIKMLNE